MFGKGIYFADTVSKSANYCHADRTNNTGIIMMCEVALGNYRRMTQAHNTLSDIPNAHEQSVKAFGLYSPIDHAIIDGVKVNAGRIVQQTHFRTALCYNEYVTYDPAQSRIKYLLKVKFNFK